MWESIQICLQCLHTLVSKLKAMDSIYFIFISHFHFHFDLFFIFLFLKLRVRVRVMRSYYHKSDDMVTVMVTGHMIYKRI